MKKIAMILILLMSGLFYLSAQTPVIRFTYTLVVPVLADTTLIIDLAEIRMDGEDKFALLIDYRTFDGVDAVLDMGYTYDAAGTLLNRFDDTRIPVTMADSTIHIEKLYFTAKYLFLKLTRNNVTTGLKAPVHLIR